VAWDGFLIMDWVHRMDEAKHTPIVIITGGDPAKYKDRSMAAGAVAFFQKPINTDELLSVIRQNLGQEAVPMPSAPSA
jgi:FixJ family two-component response regulator